MSAEQEVQSMRLSAEREIEAQRQAMRQEWEAHRRRMEQELEARREQVESEVHRARSNNRESDLRLRDIRKMEEETLQSRAAAKRLEERAMRALEATTRAAGRQMASGSEHAPQAQAQARPRASERNRAQTTNQQRSGGTSWRQRAAERRAAVVGRAGAGVASKGRECTSGGTVAHSRLHWKTTCTWTC